MPITLERAKPKLESDLRRILQKAAEEAFKTANKGDGSDMQIESYVDNAIKDAAKKFSEKFAEEAHKEMANAIYEFVREIGITMTPKSTLVAGVVPVTGTALISDFIVT